ncbi:hypothetical protein HJD18_17035 [Thermoleophilia bacterium SCSIO 60948]|nr:hypothetical protein HJD18_17035 [Thermoleophilia bacterium SCSIO 60948]
MATPRILWRVAMKATLDSLRGLSPGQYHIALARPPGIDEFFAGLPQSPKDLAGYSVEVPLEPAGDIPAQTILVYFNGWEASRKEWRIASQRPEEAYPLWRPGVGPTAETRPGDDALVLIRDSNKRFHARWLNLSELGELPEGLRTAMKSGTGTRVLEPEEFGAIAALTAIEAPPPGGSTLDLEPPAKTTSPGKPYNHVSPEKVQGATAKPFEVDPDIVDRGTQAHAATQEALAEHVIASDLSPLSPTEETPPYDLAWERDGVLFVAEVKSLTHANEEKQLRLALGQVLRYCHALRSNGLGPVQPVICSERAPSDGTWVPTCAELGVLLTWPEKFVESLGS